MTLTPKQQEQEQRANWFATALLMPLPLVREELEKAYAEMPYACLETIVTHLAERFQVSEVRMAMRLQDLGESV